jgi:CRISPR-associated endonuclease/helicase Cas3
MSQGSQSTEWMTFHAYWGKASPGGGELPPYHLLPFHCLDVAACGQVLLTLPQFSLQQLAKELGWPRDLVERLFVFFLSLHDLGKFSRAFQALAPNLSPDLVPTSHAKPYTLRHDTLGWVLWVDQLSGGFPDARLPVPGDEFWGIWMRTSVGHHGRPPEENVGGGLLGLRAQPWFLREDREAACAFVAEVAAWLLPDGIPAPGRRECEILRRHTWRLAGLAVLADWLGSNQTFFRYRTQACALSDYWEDARAQAGQAVRAAGLAAQPVRTWSEPLGLFDHLSQPTPLQRYAAEVALEPGPQLFLLEDVTGAGKTEAALVLAQRLMQAGLAGGLYFALPTMATANQMYQRVGQVYRHLYGDDAQPSLILAHGARQLVEGFRDSVVQATEQPADRGYGRDESSASATCNAWLADNRKKALLAEVGVGTVDQALLAVLPARHQSLRMLGLSGKVLLVDEVHACDDYMFALLKRLLTAHARQGGSAILLSATLPAAMRGELVQAYRFGLGLPTDEPEHDLRYPLATQAGSRIVAHACETRPQLVREVQVRALHSETDVVSFIAEHAAAGRSVCWIRNTVGDARRAQAALGGLVPAGSLSLFHSRFAIGDRLDIEDRVLQRFGKTSTAEVRRGEVLVATQVVEQSLDLDFDVLVSDLAPIDLLVQRAGRLQRHARKADGTPAPDGIERRPPPLLTLLCPSMEGAPSADWYTALFPKGTYVYPDTGRLWLGAKALFDAGRIVSPGVAGQAGAVRELVEAVYGEHAAPVPEGLRHATNKHDGKALAQQSQAGFNALSLDKGYAIDSSAHWYEDTRVPTRLGETSLTLYLARVVDGVLQPLRNADRDAWEQSAIRIEVRHASALAPAWEARFGPALQVLRASCRLLEAPAFVLPMLEVDGVLFAEILDGAGKERRMHYDAAQGLLW